MMLVDLERRDWMLTIVFRVQKILVARATPRGSLTPEAQLISEAQMIPEGRPIAWGFDLVFSLCISTWSGWSWASLVRLR